MKHVIARESHYGAYPRYTDIRALDMNIRNFTIKYNALVLDPEWGSYSF